METLGISIQSSTRLDAEILLRDFEGIGEYDLVASFEWKGGWNPSHLISKVSTYLRKCLFELILTRADPFKGINPEEMYFQRLSSYPRSIEHLLKWNNSCHYFTICR